MVYNLYEISDPKITDAAFAVFLDLVFFDLAKKMNLISKLEETPGPFEEKVDAVIKKIWSKGIINI